MCIRDSDQYEREHFMEKLTDHLEARGMLRNVQLERYHATAEEKRERSLNFRRAAQLGLVHVPMNRLAYDELSFLQLHGMKVEAPTSGPVQTDDTADSLIIVTTDILSHKRQTHRKLKRAEARYNTGPPRGASSSPAGQQLSALSQGNHSPHGTMRQNQARRRITRR